MPDQIAGAENAGLELKLNGPIPGLENVGLENDGRR